MSSIKDEIYEVDGAIRYIKFSGDYEKFYQWKENKKSITRHKGILKCMIKQVEIPTRDEADNDEDRMQIYEGKFKVQDFLIIRLTDIPYVLVGQCDENSNES